jgi:hypothetical protein
MSKANPKTHHVIPVTEILRKLQNLGYFGDQSWAQVKKTSGKALEAAIRQYQIFNGLEQTGIVEPRTAHVMARRRCGLPDFNISGRDKPCKWPMSQITYFANLTLPGISDKQAKQAYAIAFEQWALVCDIEPVRVDSPDVANIFAQSGKGKANGLDARGGTLAWSELPCDVTQNMQLDQMFDEAEDWTFDMAVAVICHEIGHALGLAHLSKGNLMAPYYDPAVSTPQKGDISEITALYGKRKKTSKLATQENTHVHGTILINGRPYMLVPQF